MEKNIKDPVKAENPTGFSVIVREFKKGQNSTFLFLCSNNIYNSCVCCISILLIYNNYKQLTSLESMKFLLSITSGISLEEIQEDVV